ncbi:MAG: class I SAM-dependent methyltransferase [Planctomycetaceae bacterium]|nr:class I SAM-dependent methyltransferase [Planctomycetaceae bacterium]
MKQIKQQPPWYVAAFGPHYLKVYAHRDERDASRAVACAERALGISPATRLLDLCCGAGRHLRLFNAKTVGLDLSLPLLAHARREGVNAPLVRGDMRTLPFAGGNFDVVVNLFTSFGYFDDDGNLTVLQEIARVLRPGGQAMLDLINPPHTLARLEAQSEERRDGMTLFIERAFDAVGKRLVKTVKIAFDDGSPEVRYQESVRIYEQPELDSLLTRAGLAALKRLGSFDGAPFDISSPRQIVIAGR